MFNNISQMHFGIQWYTRKGTEATKETKSITLATHKTLNSPPFDDHKMEEGVSMILLTEEEVDLYSAV